MSHSRQTEHYELPLYDGNDIINPLTDFNNANSSIDEALYNANQRSVGAETTANEAKDIAEGYDARVTHAEEEIASQTEKVTKTQNMIAPAFDANKQGGYSAKSVVTFADKLYQFNSAHVGAWTGLDVTKITLAEFLVNIVVSQ